MPIFNEILVILPQYVRGCVHGRRPFVVLCACHVFEGLNVRATMTETILDLLPHSNYIPLPKCLCVLALSPACTECKHVVGREYLERTEYIDVQQQRIG